MLFRGQLYNTALFSDGFFHRRTFALPTGGKQFLLKETRSKFELLKQESNFIIEPMRLFELPQERVFTLRKKS